VELQSLFILPLSDWHDTDGDGIFDSVEQALHDYDASLADPQDANVTPAYDAIADASIAAATGNRYPSVMEAYEAAQQSRGEKPYVVIKVEAGQYHEDLQIEANGIVFQGPFQEKQAVILRENIQLAPSIRGQRIVFDGLVFGDGSHDAGATLDAGVAGYGIIFANCAWHGQTPYIYPNDTLNNLQITQGNVHLIHSSLQDIGHLRTGNSGYLNMYYSLMESNQQAILSQGNAIHNHDSLLRTGIRQESDRYVRADGLMRTMAKPYLQNRILTPENVLINWRDIQGEARDDQADIGCDEWVDTDSDDLPDAWEIKWFGDLNDQGATGNPDSDDYINSIEYDQGTNPTLATDSSEVEDGGYFDLYAFESYQGENLLGSRALPGVDSAHWLYSADDEVQLIGPQGDIEYHFELTQPTVAALLLDVIFQKIGSNSTIDGEVTVYLNDAVVANIKGSTENVIVPLKKLNAGSYTVRVELINAKRDYRPIVRKLEVRALSEDLDLERVAEELSQGESKITIFPSQSKVSPAYIEGEHNSMNQVQILNKTRGDLVEARAGIDHVWFANVDLEQGITAVEYTDSASGLVLNKEIEWIDTVLEQDETAILRKGDSLRLRSLAEGYGDSSMVSYVIGGEIIGEALVGSALQYYFDQAGTYQITAQVDGVVVPDAMLMVEVHDASFEQEMAVARNLGRGTLSTTIDLPAPFTDLHLEGAEALNLTRYTGQIAVKPDFDGAHRVMARLYPGGPILATGEIQVFSFSGTGINGSGKLLETREGYNLIEMTHLLNGTLPPNVLIRVQVWISGTTFVDGTTEKWLSSQDFDESGVAHLYVKASGKGICQNVSVFQIEEE
jgi:hypothetical protein